MRGIGMGGTGMDEIILVYSYDLTFDDLPVERLTQKCGHPKKKRTAFFTLS